MSRTLLGAPVRAMRRDDPGAQGGEMAFAAGRWRVGFIDGDTRFMARHVIRESSCAARFRSVKAFMSAHGNDMIDRPFGRRQA